MSSYSESINCTVCNHKFVGNFLDKSHYFNAIMLAICPNCGCYVFNDQFRELINQVKSIEES